MTMEYRNLSMIKCVKSGIKHASAVLFGAVLVAGLQTIGFAGEIRFKDVTSETGLEEHLKTWRLSHAASWGDLNGDGWPELYIGAFANRPRWYDGPLPNMLFVSDKGRKFELDDQKHLQYEELYARPSHVLMVDLDQDNDLEIIVACHTTKTNEVMTKIWKNDGEGSFMDATPSEGYWPNPMGWRNIAPVDLNGDGLLDLAAYDNNYSNWNTGKGSLMVLINKGNMVFEDGREAYGLPEDGTTGFGLAVGDVNDDGQLDFFVADSNRMFVSGPDGKYKEIQRGTFIKPQTKDKTSRTCGAVFGDANGDGLLDLLTGEHGKDAQLRLYINEGIKDGVPSFRDVTKETGLMGALPPKGLTDLAVKIGNIAIIDLDNDSKNDLLVSVIWRDEEGALQPMSFRNLGNGPDGLPRFSKPPLERAVGYYASSPIVDFDRDGRVDFFLGAWFDWDETPSILFRNVTEGGHWLIVRVAGSGRRNTMGVGATVRVYEAGRAGEPDALLQRSDIVVSNGYSSGEEALAHLGLGTNAVVDVVVRWDDETKTLAGVMADQYLRVDFK